MNLNFVKNIGLGLNFTYKFEVCYSWKYLHKKKEYRKHRVAKNPKLQYTEVDNGRDKKCVTESPTNMSIRERFGVGVMKEGKGEGEMDLKKTINGVLWEYFPEGDLFNFQCPNIKKKYVRLPKTNFERRKNIGFQKYVSFFVEDLNWSGRLKADNKYISMFCYSWVLLNILMKTRLWFLQIIWSHNRDITCIITQIHLNKIIHNCITNIIFFLYCASLWCFGVF